MGACHLRYHSWSVLPQLAATRWPLPSPPLVACCRSVTVVAVLVALRSPVDHALATSACVTTARRAPSELFCYPADLCPAVGAPHPVTAPLFQKQDLTAWAVECFSLLDKILNPFFCLFRVLILRISEHILLVLLAVHPIVHSLTGDTVGSLTKRALEDVHVVLNHRPAGAVRCLAMEGILNIRLRLLDRLLLVLLQHGRGDQSLDLPLQHLHVARVVLVLERAFHLRSVRMLDCCGQTKLAECVETFSQNHPVTRFRFKEADGALKGFSVRNDVKVLQLLVRIQVVLLLPLLLLLALHHQLLLHRTSPDVSRPLGSASKTARPLKRVPQRAHRTHPAFTLVLSLYCHCWRHYWFFPPLCQMVSH